jgi:hypothetical protein
MINNRGDDVLLLEILTCLHNDRILSRITESARLRALVALCVEISSTIFCTPC